MPKTDINPEAELEATLRRQAEITARRDAIPAEIAALDRERGAAFAAGTSTAALENQRADLVAERDRLEQAASFLAGTEIPRQVSAVLPARWQAAFAEREAASESVRIAREKVGDAERAAEDAHKAFRAEQQAAERASARAQRIADEIRRHREQHPQFHQEVLEP